MTRKPTLWLLLTIAFAIGVIVFAFSHIVTDPGHAVTELGGDAAKNTFTYVYHSMYGSGYHFDGMNYPYGEHIIYTDGQPLISVLFASLGHVSANTALATMWLLIGLSYVLAIIFLYKILVHYKAHPLAAMLFAGLITIFSPQVFRLQGHYALAYACLIPMVFYWNILYHERKALRYCVYIFVAGSLMAFLHLYFAAMLLFWAAGYAIGYLSLERRERLAGRIKHVAPVLVAAVCVFMLLSVTIKLTDIVHDRPVTPYANTETNTRAKLLLTSAHSPIWQYALKRSWVPSAANKEEGYVYIGFAVAMTLGIAVLLWLLRKLNISKEPAPAGLANFSPVWFVVAVFVLLLSMGIPFIWHMQWLMDVVPAFKQFRSMGRFSWVFYYIVSVYAALFISRYSEELVRRGKLAVGLAVFIVPFSLWTFEASGYVKYTRGLAEMSRYNYEAMFPAKEQNWQTFLGQHGHKGADFQSLLLLRYFHVGSEKWWVGDGSWLVSLGVRPAMELRLPIMNVMLSRSSWNETAKQVKIAAGPFADKPVLRELKSNKPFLLLHFEEDSLDEDQKYLLAASEYIGHHVQCDVYACYPERIVANDKAALRKVSDILPHMKGADTCIGCNSGFYTLHLDFGYQNERKTKIATIPVLPQADSERYEFSIWLLLDKKDYKSPNIVLQLTDSSGRKISGVDAVTKQSVDNEGMWFRTSAYFYMPSSCRSISCILVDDQLRSYTSIGELLLRPAQATIISKRDNKVMVNNHWVKKK
ncbi:MAG: hypothetical protein V4649_12630 [Bacteroidota bacterium]